MTVANLSNAGFGYPIIHSVVIGKAEALNFLVQPNWYWTTDSEGVLLCGSKNGDVHYFYLG